VHPFDLYAPPPSHHGEEEANYGLLCPDTLQAVNDENGSTNSASNQELGITGTIPQVAKQLKARRQPWALVVDENYGEVK
jgi:hypothetical protein